MTAPAAPHHRVSTSEATAAALHHRGLPYAAGLDGLRAVAVTAVLVFHAAVPGTPGGFLGVDLFFVISGFLITSLLLVDFERRGKVGLVDFYVRRARRLLPAVYLLLIAVTAYCALFARGELESLRGQVLSALAYVTNWYFVVVHQSYFQALGRPPLLLHLWSLALEEQYYIAWALVLALVLPRLRRRRRPLAIGLVLGVLGSTALMAALYNPFADPSRVYYGTFTHVAPLLVGSLLALFWNPARLRPIIAPGAVTVLDVAGAAALAAFVWFVANATQNSTWMYRGGFLVVALIGAVAVAVAVHPASRVGRALGWSPILWLGVRSYSIYLWHWPVFVLTRPHLDVPLSGVPLFVVRMAITLVLADLAFRFVETPIRRGALSRWFARVRGSEADERKRLLGVGVVSGVSLLAVVGLLGLQLLNAPRGDNVALGGNAGPGHRVADPKPGRDAGRLAALGPAHPLPAQLRVTVVGDSQGMTLLLNVSDAVTQQFGFTDGTVEGCGVLEGKITSTQGMRRDLGAECAGWAQKWHDHVAASHAQIGLVMIGAWDVFDVQVDGKTLAFGSPAWDAYFQQQLAKGIKAVKSAGATVALAELPCYRPISAGGLPALPERGDDSRTRHVNTLLEAAAARDPHHVVTVHPPAAFCTNDQIANDVNYRWDGVHYYIPGATLFMRVVGPQLLAIAHHLPTSG